MIRFMSSIDTCFAGFFTMPLSDESECAAGMDPSAFIDRLISSPAKLSFAGLSGSRVAQLSPRSPAAITYAGVITNFPFCTSTRT